MKMDNMMISDNSDKERIGLINKLESMNEQYAYYCRNIEKYTGKSILDLHSVTMFQRNARAVVQYGNQRENKRNN